jgi:hypothetical protein
MKVTFREPTAEDIGYVTPLIPDADIGDMDRFPGCTRLDVVNHVLSTAVISRVLDVDGTPTAIVGIVGKADPGSVWILRTPDFVFNRVSKALFASLLAQSGLKAVQGTIPISETEKLSWISELGGQFIPDHPVEAYGRECFRFQILAPEKDKP